MSLCVDNRLLCTLNGHLYRVTFTRCCIDTINSPDDGHMAARNIQRIEINIHEKELCVKLVIYKAKYLSDMFFVKYGLKQGDAISPLVFNFTLEYAIMKVNRIV